MRGQKSRAGRGKGVRHGFEGGQTPLYRRIPKYPGNPHRGHKKTKFTLIPLIELEVADDNATVDFEYLAERGFTRRRKVPRKMRLFKVTGGLEYFSKKGLTVRAHAFTKSARALIEANGGTCVLMSRTRNITLEEDKKRKRALWADQAAKRKALRELKARTKSAVEA